MGGERYPLSQPSPPHLSSVFFLIKAVCLSSKLLTRDITDYYVAVVVFFPECFVYLPLLAALV